MAEHLSAFEESLTNVTEACLSKMLDLNIVLQVKQMDYPSSVRLCKAVSHWAPKHVRQDLSCSTSVLPPLGRIPAARTERRNTFM